MASEEVVNPTIFKGLQVDETDQKPSGVDLKNRTIEGWVSPVEFDRDKEIVLPGAFVLIMEIYNG